MAKREKAVLTKLELQIMQVIWKRGASTVTEAKASIHAVRDLVDRMFGGSSEELVMSLIKSRQIDPQKIAELSKRLEEEES